MAETRLSACSTATPELPVAVQGGKKWTEQRLTDEPHPFPALRDMQKQLLRYKRADGVDLNGELFTPPGYDAKRDGPLPCILWAYPRRASRL